MDNDIEKFRAKLRAMRNADKKPQKVQLSTVYKTLKRGLSVFLVFENNADRQKYQQRILKEASEFLDREPLGGVPKGSFVGARTFAWDNGAEIAFSTETPGDPNGTLSMEPKSLPNTEILRPEIPLFWN